MTEPQSTEYVELPEPVKIPTAGLTLRHRANEHEHRAARFQQEAAEHRAAADVLEKSAATLLGGARQYRAAARALEGDQ